MTFKKKVLSSDLFFLFSVFSGRFLIRSVTRWLWDRHPGKHALVPSYTTQYTACPRLLSTPWELLLWRAVHCATGAIERDEEIKHKFRIDLQNRSNSLSWHWAACSHNITRLNNRARPGQSNCFTLGHSRVWTESSFIPLLQCSTCTHWAIQPSQLKIHFSRVWYM